MLTLLAIASTKSADISISSSLFQNQRQPFYGTQKAMALDAGIAVVMNPLWDIVIKSADGSKMEGFVSPISI